MSAFLQKLRTLRRPLHISHRGGSALWPENTLLAFEHAVRICRTQMLELDVHRSADGVFFVAHDPDVGRCTDGAGLIRELRSDQLSALDAGFRFTKDGGHSFPFRSQGVRLPTLREVLRAFPDMLFNIEVKPDEPGIEAAFAALLREEGAAERVCVGSEGDALAARLRTELPEASHFYPRDALSALVLALKLAGDVPDEPRYEVLDMPDTFEGQELVDAELLARVEALGRWVNVWTVDDPARMKVLAELGVGGIMTDRPDFLRSVLDGV